MNNHYDVHSWSTQYREARLAAARTRPLEGQLRTARDRPTRLALSVAALLLVALLLVGSGCTGSDVGTVDTDPAGASTEAARFAGMRSSSMECYTFYSDGTVELRHGGTSNVNDTGSYQGDEDFGEIVWDSGRWTSTVVGDGDGLIIDDETFSPVDSCF